eukprot:15436732-Alexandrium_andersonii.AAC.1
MEGCLDEHPGFLPPEEPKDLMSIAATLLENPPAATTFVRGGSARKSEAEVASSEAGLASGSTDADK